MMDLLWRFLLLQLGGWAVVLFVFLSWMIWTRLQDMRKVELPKFEDLEPAILGPVPEPWWAWPGRVLFWSAYVVFFMVSIPLTLWLWKSGALEGGQAFDYEDELEWAQAQKGAPGIDDVDWGAVHRGEIEAPEFLRTPDQED